MNPYESPLGCHLLLAGALLIVNDVRRFTALMCVHHILGAPSMIVQTVWWDTDVENGELPVPTAFSVPALN